ncbi:hypothetical protein L6452_44032 [Arctium lappa]|uniref:Uncharacterized protein n=1 Tax=Arctium lappa TaxID=4217 RepID=A0ACB8XEH7_ARCLA|nr:hypothetical protein L6452_44032 [Arctium lappa]
MPPLTSTSPFSQYAPHLCPPSNNRRQEKLMQTRTHSNRPRYEPPTLASIYTYIPLYISLAGYLLSVALHYT